MDSRISRHKGNNFAKALLLSLALHALVLSLQFGDSDSGLPWFGMPGESKIASIPMLNAVLHAQPVVEKLRPEPVVQPVVSSSVQPTASLQVKETPPPSLPTEPVTASIARLEPRPQEPVAKIPVARAVAEAPKIVAPAADVAVLSTDKESTWSRPAGDGETQNKQEGSEQTKETPVPEQKTVDDQARIEAEKAALESAAREKELALEKKRVEEQARLEAIKAEQAAAARARDAAALAQKAEADALVRKREAEKLAAEKAAKEAAEKILAEQQKMAEEQARIEKEKAAQAAAAAARDQQLALEKKRAEEQARHEAMKAEQAAAARAREDAARAKQAEAEALARKGEADRLAAEKAAKEAAGKALAEQQNRLSNAAAGKPDGGKESGNGQTAGPTAPRGGELARKAIDAIKSGQMDMPGIESAEPVLPRRGSILGRNPRDIQLAFYGEGWRLKVERIGSMNYPPLSRNLTYDPLKVTVSINSDGTLAGVRIVTSSGHKDLDEAVVRIVTMSAPFSPFPPAMKRMYDVVDITRTWIFLEYQPRIAN